MASQTVAVSRRGLIVGGLVVAGVAGFLWWRARQRAAAAAAASQTQQPSVSATAPAPVPGTNMAGVVDIVQGPPGTNVKVTDLQTGLQKGYGSRG